MPGGKPTPTVGAKLGPTDLPSNVLPRHLHRPRHPQGKRAATREKTLEFTRSGKTANLLARAV